MTFILGEGDPFEVFQKITLRNDSEPRTETLGELAARWEGSYEQFLMERYSHPDPR